MGNFLFLVQLNASALRFNHVCSGFEMEIATVYHARISNLNQAHTPVPQAPPFTPVATVAKAGNGMNHKWR